ncbi:hypothetical protein Bca4012_019130 [Brassica carinata]
MELGKPTSSPTTTRFPVTFTAKSIADRSLKRLAPISYSEAGVPQVTIPDEVFIRGAEMHKEFIIGCLQFAPTAVPPDWVPELVLPTPAETNEQPPSQTEPIQSDPIQTDPIQTDSQIITCASQDYPPDQNAPMDPEFESDLQEIPSPPPSTSIQPYTNTSPISPSCFTQISYSPPSPLSSQTVIFLDTPSESTFVFALAANKQRRPFPFKHKLHQKSQHPNP